MSINSTIFVNLNNIKSLDDSQFTGRKKLENRPSIEAKALRINLNEYIYGTFAEIEHGQEVVRHFFRAGSSSGTIAKTMSAYDKNFSDNIYGGENDKRYVTEARLNKMLDHEMELLETDYQEINIQTKCFLPTLIQSQLLTSQKNLKDTVGWV